MSKKARTAGDELMPGRYEGDGLCTTTIPPGYQVVPDYVVEALLLWSYCPQEASYQDGPSIEDVCETLGEAVENWTGVPQPQEWWTVDEMKAHLSDPLGNE